MKNVWIGLERLSFLAVIAVALVVLFRQLPSNREASTGASEFTVPTDPLSLAGRQAAGSSTAQVGMIMFSDFQCPYCSKFAQETWPRLEREYIDTGQVLAVFWNVPLKALHPSAPHAAAIAECAGRQGQFWQVHDLFFGVSKVAPALTKDSTNESIDSRIWSVAIDHAMLKECVAGDALQKVQADVADAAALGVRSTPIFLVGRVEANHTLRASRVIRGAKPIEEFRAALGELLTHR
jgi:protein-disulfide isomerase